MSLPVLSARVIDTQVWVTRAALSENPHQDIVAAFTRMPQTEPAVFAALWANPAFGPCGMLARTCLKTPTHLPPSALPTGLDPTHPSFSSNGFQPRETLHGAVAPGTVHGSDDGLWKKGCDLLYTHTPRTTSPFYTPVEEEGTDTETVFGSVHYLAMQLLQHKAYSAFHESVVSEKDGVPQLNTEYLFEACFDNSGYGGTFGPCVAFFRDLYSQNPLLCVALLTGPLHPNPLLRNDPHGILD